LLINCPLGFTPQANIQSNFAPIKKTHIFYLFFSLFTADEITQINAITLGEVIGKVTNVLVHGQPGVNNGNREVQADVFIHRGSGRACLHSKMGEDFISWQNLCPIPFVNLTNKIIIN